MPATERVDVLLIFPPAPAYLPGDPWGEYLLGLSPPMGLLYLAAHLERAGYTVRVLDGAVMARHGRSLRAAIAGFMPRLVGISTVTLNAPNAARVAEFVRTCRPGVPVVAGGPHASFCYEELLAGPHGLDCVVLFEGEAALLDLVHYYLEGRGSLEAIAGIAYRDGEQTISTGRRPFIRDLDQLAFPARHLLDLHEYVQPGILLTSRGCPFECIFCAAGPISGRRFRPRSAANVLAEVQECVERFGLRSLFFADDCFTVMRARCEAICAGLQALGNPVQWTCEGRVDTVDRQLLATLKAAGCLGLQFGVESGSDAILAKLRKNITRDEIWQAVAWTVELGMKAVCSLQIGHPDDTPATIDETLQFAAALRKLASEPGQVVTDFAVSTPLPGTYLRRHAAELGLEILHNDWGRYTFIEPVMNTRYLTAEQLSTYVLKVSLPAAEGGGSA